MNNKQTVFVEEYLKCWNAAEAARRAGYSENTARQMGYENLTKPDIKAAIQERLAEVHMSADEALALQSEIARSNIGVFFKVIEEWMFDPLPTYEILGQKEVVDDSDESNPIKRISYWVRHVAIDLDKVIDPRYSHLIHKFTDSRRTGLGIETYDKQTAIRDALKVHGRFTERVDLTSNGESIAQPLPDEERLARMKQLASTIAEEIKKTDA